MSSAAAAGAAAGTAISPGLGTVIGGVIGGAADLFAGSQSARAAEKNYKHRYQWMVKDLQKAGLNPMLAVSQGPGSVPQPDFPTGGAQEGARVGSAAALARLEAKLLETQEDAARATANKTDAEGVAQDMQNLITQASPIYQSAKATLGPGGQVTGPSALANERWQAELKQVQGQAEKASNDAEVSRLQAEISRGELSLQQVRIKYAPVLAEIEAAYKSAMAKAAQAGVPAAQADAAFWETSGAWGKAAMFLKQIIGGGIAPVILK